MSQLWHKVRSWLRRGVRGTNPRPLPILLEDLYSPAARATYRSTRTWELRLTDGLGRLGREGARLVDEIRDVARLVRCHLLLVQRIRHVAQLLPDSTYERIWREHRLTWSSPVVLKVEHLLELSAPFERGAVTARDDLLAIEESATALAAHMHGTNDRISRVLESAPAIPSRHHQ